MKILHTVQRYEPYKGGSEEVIRQLSERLVERGHQVTVATARHPRRNLASLNGVKLKAFDVSGSMSLGINGDPDAYRRFLLSAKFDVILNYAAQIWSTDLAFEILESLPGRKVFVPCGYNLTDPRFHTYYEELPRHLLKYDALVYMSENYQDKAFGDHHGVGDRAVIIPNGAATEEFAVPSLPFRTRYNIDTPLMVLAVSNHHSLKGHGKVIHAFKSLRRKDVTLVIIGEREPRLRHGCYAACYFESLRHPRIKLLTSLERRWIVAAYKQADLFVLGSEIECAPLVIYESMAAGLPFLTTKCGNVGDNSDCGVVVDDAGALGFQMARLLDDSDLRSQLGNNGKAVWAAGHTWDRIVDRYEDLYKGLGAAHC